MAGRMPLEDAVRAPGKPKRAKASRHFRFGRKQEHGPRALVAIPS